MHLKAVEMENFKSFGGKLVVPLMEGYTAVTGPNGSGKSNITDAILFVLGPKSSKAVRAGKLTDLIFDGGKSKGKASFTKVSLVFDNTDRLMPWDDDTVRLTRYVKLSDNGTDYSSYFYVNDRKSTMTEFDSLLTKARISADGYNLVQQGDVTRIVQMGAIERRRIIDAISGIASFDADIEKARTERQEAETNLDRIGLVVEELTHQVDRLARDREDARAYLEAQAALEMAKAQYSHRKLQMEQAKQQGVADQMSKLESRIDSDRAAKAELESQRADREAQISEKEEEIASKVGPEYRELKAKIEQAKIDLATRKDRREAAEADMEEQNGFKASFEESISRNNAEVVMLRQNREDLLVKMAEAESRMEAARKEEAEVSAAIADTGGEQKELQSELERVEADFDACSAELRSSQGRLAKAEAASEEAHTAFANLDERIQSIDFEIKDAKWSLEQVKAEAGPSTEDFGNRILDAKRRESELEKQETELVSAYRRIDAEYNALQAEKKVSERMNRGSAAVEAILSLRNRGEMGGIHGTIQELATVDKGFETALSVAAGGKMQAVVVDNDQVAADAIAYLKKEKLGRVTFLPLTKMIGGKPRAKAIMSVKDSEGYAIDLIDFDQKYYNAFWYVLGDTLVVRDMDTARRIMGGIRIVTMGGELIEASGAMVGGNLSQQNMLKFGAASEDKLAEVGEKLRKAGDALEDVRQRLRQVRDEIRGIDDEMRKASASGMEQREQMAQLKGRVAELEKTRSSASAEMKAARQRMSDADAELESARTAFGDVSERLSALTDSRAKIKSRMHLGLQAPARRHRHGGRGIRQAERVPTGAAGLGEPRHRGGCARHRGQQGADGEGQDRPGRAPRHRIGDGGRHRGPAQSEGRAGGRQVPSRLRDQGEVEGHGELRRGTRILQGPGDPARTVGRGTEGGGGGDNDRGRHADTLGGGDQTHDKGPGVHHGEAGQREPPRHPGVRRAQGPSRRPERRGGESQPPHQGAHRPDVQPDVQEEGAVHAVLQRGERELQIDIRPALRRG